jgi:hypothetical protein
MLHLYLPCLSCYIKVTLKLWDGSVELNCSDSGQGEMLGCFERGNETPGSIKRQEFLEYMQDY